MTIQILPARLANQIAAGEVVERPASVVKELVENSIDAGATRIEVDIEKGGSKLIRVHDNGSGIDQDELALALSRHATSKISSLDDLEAIISLGFRGEALASISSVSRLTLTSRTEKQSEAWSAYAEGRDMAVKLKPAAHPVGSTVEVLDLFFNTPARRKFLRTEKTEFTHIDELLKRIALSRFDITIILRHNGAIVRQFRAASNDTQMQKRLAAICGSNFASQAVKIETSHQGLSLQGWICTPQGARAQNDIQHCFVNQRMMKDKLINHAIRQGYETSLAPEQFAAYVLYIEIDPHQVDVNVHPAKHEVRFHQARLVHDFIFQAVRDALLQVSNTQFELNEDTPEFVTSDVEDFHASFSGNNPVSHSKPVDQSHRQTNSTLGSFNHYSVSKDNSFSSQASAYSSNEARSRHDELSPQSKNQHFDAWRPSNSPTRTEQQIYQNLLKVDAKPTDLIVNESNQSLGKSLAIVSSKYLLLQQNADIRLLDLNYASYLLSLGKLQAAKKEGLKTQPLLIPQKMNFSDQEIVLLLKYEEILQKFGIFLQQKNSSQILIMSVCQMLRERNLQQFFNNLIIFISSNNQSDDISIENICTWLATELMVKSDIFSLSQAVSLLSDLENCWQGELVTFYPKLLRSVDLVTLIDSFKDE